MKTKITVFRSSCLALSLLGSTGIAFALAEVESHSQSGWIQGSPSGTPTENPTLDLLRKIEFLQQEMQELRGKVEEQSYQLGKLKNEPAKESPKENVEAEMPSESANTVDFPIPMGAILQDQALAEEKAYQQAYHLIQSKDYNGATLAFKSLIKTFPEGKYIPNAHYWLGEIYMAKGDLQLAYEAFDSVFKQYSDHPKAADSLLKLGYVEYAKGQWKRSQALLQQVKSQFPGSTSAQLAEAKLQSMHKEGNL